MEKFVYFFGNGKADGHGTMKDVLGGKGAGLGSSRVYYCNFCMPRLF